MIAPPHGIDEIRRVYGDISIARIGPEWMIESPIAWEEANCVTARDLPGLNNRPLYVNRLILDPLRWALSTAVAACPAYEIVTIGCFNPRFKRVNGSELSLHTWAVAVDINAATNPMRHPMETDMPDDFVHAFEAAGFTWGGNFRIPDPQHFQYANGY